MSGEVLRDFKQKIRLPICNWTHNLTGTVDMKVSKRGEYALRALIDIGIADELGRPLVQIGELAEKENLPIKFLEQILMQLKEAGYIESKRGKRGGYFLAVPPKRVKVGQVIRLIDGPLAPISCVSHTEYERCSCPDEEHCGLHMLMNDVRNAIANILDKFTLADTIDMTLKKVRRDKASIPFIDALLAQPVSGIAAEAPVARGSGRKAAVSEEESPKPKVSSRAKRSVKNSVAATRPKASVNALKPKRVKA